MSETNFNSAKLGKPELCFSDPSVLLDLGVETLA